MGLVSACCDISFLRDVKVDAILEQLRTKAEKGDVRSAKKEILKKLDGEDEKQLRKRGVRSKVRREQVKAVKTKLIEMANQGMKMSLHAACVAVWQDLKGGYPSAKALYFYCHANIKEFTNCSL